MKIFIDIDDIDEDLLIRLVDLLTAERTLTLEPQQPPLRVEDTEPAPNWPSPSPHRFRRNGNDHA